jgi:hypothetical protein
MGQPYYGVATDHTISLPNICPVGVLSQVEKNAQRAPICAIGQHDLFTFTECGVNRHSAHHFRVPFDSFFVAPLVMVETWLVHKPRLFQFRFSCFFLTGQPGSWMQLGVT